MKRWFGSGRVFLSTLIFFSVIQAAFSNPPVSSGPKKSIFPGLPPSLTAFLNLMLQVSDIQTDEYRRFQPDLTDSDKAKRFLKGLKLIVAAHRYPREAIPKGQKIRSLEQYISVTEPLFINNGFFDADAIVFQSLVDEFTKNNSNVPRARDVKLKLASEGGDFETYDALIEAKVYIYQRNAYLKKLFLSAAADGVASDEAPIMEIFMRGIFRFLLQGGNAATALRKIADSSESTNLKDKFEKLLSVRMIKAPDLLRGAADVMDHLSELTEFEEKFLDLLEGLHKSSEDDIDKALAFIKSFEVTLKGVVEAIQSMGKRLNNFLDMQLLASQADSEVDKDLFDFLRLFLDDYPKKLPPSVFKEVLWEMARLSMENTDDKQIIRILFNNFGPIPTNLFQRIAHRFHRHPALKRIGAICKGLQKNSCRMPVVAAQKVLDKYPDFKGWTIVSQLSAGKFYETFVAEKAGEYEVFRILKPKVGELLKHDYNALTELAPQIGRIIFRDIKNIEVAERLTKQLIRAERDNLAEELKLSQTKKNQEAGRERLASTHVVETSRGKINLEFTAPTITRIDPSGAEIMGMEYIKDPIEISKLAQSQPDIARIISDMLIEKFFNTLVFNPFHELKEKTEEYQQKRVKVQDGLKNASLTKEEKDKAQKDLKEIEENLDNLEELVVMGIAHRDLHDGNILIQIDEKTEPYPTYRVYVIDWGLTSWVNMKQIKQIMILAFGAGTNNAHIIFRSLMELKQSTNNRHPDDIFRIIKNQCKQLNREKGYWGVGDWIEFMFLNNILDFNNSLIGLKNAQQALEGLFLEIKQPKSEFGRVLAKLSAENRGRAIGLAWKEHPYRSFLSGQTVAQWIREKRWQCTDYLMSWFRPMGEVSDPTRASSH